MDHALPRLGVGVVYQPRLHHAIMANADRIDFLEVISDNYLYSAPAERDRLRALRDRFPLVPHGTNLSVGTATSLDVDYLDRLAAVVETAAPPWFSDHLNVARVPGAGAADLRPLWFTEHSLETVCRNVRQVKARIATPFLLENITYHFPIPDSEMSEARFISRVLTETDSGLLLDVNSVWANSMNHGFDPYEFLRSIPLERTVQLHLAGGRRADPLLADLYGARADEAVWDLLAYVVGHAPVKAIQLDWDPDPSALAELLDQLDRARRVLAARGRPLLAGARS